MRNIYIYFVVTVHYLEEVFTHSWFGDQNGAMATLSTPTSEI